MSEDTRIGGGWWSDIEGLQGLPPLGTVGPNLAAVIDTETRQVTWQEIIASGHYENVTNGDTDTPEPVYTWDALDCPHFMILWIPEL
jgi:hypothetical protein